MEDKKVKVLKMLEMAKDRLEEALESVDNMLAEIEDVETAEELWEKLTDGDLEEAKDNALFASQDIDEALDEADYDLEEMAREEEEDEDDEE